MALILLRSSWQTVNIGDIGHTPGMLRLLADHIPEARVVLWANHLDRGVGDMLQREFPGVVAFESGTDAEGLPTHPEIRRAWENADLFLHGSGPYVVAPEALAGWRRHGGGRPCGIFGISLEACDEALKDLLSGAAFLYFRDTISLGFAKRAGISCPIMEFAPDAAFAARERDDERAEAFLREVGLWGERFVCVVPRLRYTPYFKMQGRAPNEREASRAAVSREFKDSDMTKLREAIVGCVRQGGLRVLVCPEMTYQIELGQELVASLPEDVKARAVARDSFWCPDEAAGVYAKALAVVSIEMHSPILAQAQGTPAIHVRQPTDTCKGQMWRDVGLADWIFEIDEAKGADIAATVLRIQSAPDAASMAVARAASLVVKRHAEAMGVARSVLRSAPASVLTR